jgi:hypothetical protein
VAKVKCQDRSRTGSKTSHHPESFANGLDMTRRDGLSSKNGIAAELKNNPAWPELQRLEAPRRSRSCVRGQGSIAQAVAAVLKQFLELSGT